MRISTSTSPRCGGRAAAVAARGHGGHQGEHVHRDDAEVDPGRLHRLPQQRQGDLEEGLGAARAVEQRRLVDVLGDGLHGRREEHEVEADAVPDEDGHQAPEHQVGVVEPVHRVLGVDQAGLDQHAVEQAAGVGAVHGPQEHREDREGEHLREEVHDLVEGGAADALHAAGPPLPPRSP